MRSVGLKVLKNKLSEYVRLAASGETVLVTDRDRVVAEIVPPQPGSQPTPCGCAVGRGGPQGLTDATRARWQWGDAAAQTRHGLPHDLMQELQQDREDR